MTVTVSDVIAMCPTSLPDSVVEDILAMVYERMGDCVASSYPTEGTQDTLIKYATCHFIAMADGNEASQEKSANGASTSFEIHGGGDGLRATQWGRLLIQADTAGCYSNLVADTFMLVGIGPSNPSCY